MRAHSGRPFDAVIVPGGGVWDGGKLPPWVENRFDKALDIANGVFIVPLSAGTPHKPSPLDSAGRPIFESAAGAEYLRGRGYPAELILVEAASYDTIGNAYFARVVHTDPARLPKLAVVTSQFHMARTEAIFRWIFSVPPDECAYDLTFFSVPDAGMSAEALHARRQKEEASLPQVHRLAQEHRTLPSVHNWLFSQHGAYMARRRREPAANEDALLQSY